MLTFANLRIAFVSSSTQERLLPPRPQAGEHPLLLAGPRQDRGLRACARDPLLAALHGLREHALVPRARGPAALHQLLQPHRRVGGRLHHGGIKTPMKIFSTRDNNIF